jgi:hypothetical protein
MGGGLQCDGNPFRKCSVKYVELDIVQLRDALERRVYQAKIGEKVNVLLRERRVEVLYKYL